MNDAGIILAVVQSGGCASIENGKTSYTFPSTDALMAFVGKQATAIDRALDKMVAENERLGLYDKPAGWVEASACPPCNNNCNQGRDCPARR